MIDDKELQRIIENKEPVENSSDATLYRKIFDVLGSEAYQLPPDFADRVVAKAKSKSSFFGEYFWICVGLVCFLTAGAGTAAFLHFRLNFGSFKFISGYSGLIVFGIFFVLALQWIDRNVVQKHITSQS